MAAAPGEASGTDRSCTWRAAVRMTVAMLRQTHGRLVLPTTAADVFPGRSAIFPARGLSNPDVQCYANAAMQLLLACGGFLQGVRRTLARVLRTQTTTTLQGPLVLCVTSLLTALVQSGARGARGARGTACAIDAHLPRGLLAYLSAVGEVPGLRALALAPFQQQDAQEWVVHFLDLLGTARILDTRALFGVWVAHRLRCGACGHKGAVVLEEQEGVLLALEADRGSATLLQSLLDAYFSNHEAVRDYRCSACGVRGSCERTTGPLLARPPPPYLLVRLKREYFHRSTGTTLVQHTPIQVTAQVHLARRHQAAVPYVLLAAAYKTGGAAGGHWTATRRVHSQWYLCNDGVVLPVPAASVTQVPSTTVAMALYRRGDGATQP